MRIQFKMEGGIASFPGLSKPITIDSDQLPQQESDELKRLVNTTHFFDLPAVIGSPAPELRDRQSLVLLNGNRPWYGCSGQDLVRDAAESVVDRTIRGRGSGSSCAGTDLGTRWNGAAAGTADCPSDSYSAGHHLGHAAEQSRLGLLG